MTIHKFLTFTDAIKLAHKVSIVKEIADHPHIVRLYLKDGTSLEFHSEFDGDYSEYTPGAGIELPTVRHVT